ncbi:MAG: hypothetical protein AAB570_01635 [Patescibacteria group bacterium]
MNDPSDQKGGAMRLSDAALAAARNVGREMLATGERYALLGERGHATMAVAVDRALLRVAVATVDVDGTPVYVGLPQAAPESTS